MANPKFFGVDLNLQTYSWSSGESAFYPLTNLKNYYPDIYSQSNNVAANQTFNFLRVSAINMLLWDGTNFGDLGTSSIKLQHELTPGNWVDSGSLSMLSVTNTLDVVDVAVTNWRLQFNKASSLTNGPKIGNIFFGTTLNFEKTQEWNFYNDMPDFNIQASRTLDNRLRTSDRGGFARHEVEFKLHTDSFVIQWRAFLRTVRGGGRPFYYIDNNSNIWLVNFEKSFNPAKALRYNINDIVRFTLVSTLGE